MRLVKIWSDQSASAIQAFHTSFGVGAMIGPFAVAPFLGRREGDLIVQVGRKQSKTDECCPRRSYSDTIIIRESPFGGQATQIQIPFAVFGVLYLCTACSMLAAFICDPASIKKVEGQNEKNDDRPSKTFESLLMVLLFIYLVIVINTETAFSSESLGCSAYVI